ncbi:MAG: Si-specific NAD(P)(+) transhydrogenase [Verrucomicrobia bacterium]|nr:MAG: Si-specific NAD(P)(+) transhydrogenase [Verrucomicrobiota bacterium]
MIPEENRFDLVVIGSGPGGQKAAIQGAKAGLRVALIERERSVGGACVYTGTIPSKTLREAALALLAVKRSAGFLDVKLAEQTEISTLMARLDAVLEAHERLIGEYLDHNGVRVFRGRGSLVDAHTVAVQSVRGEDTLLQTEFVVIATGSRPRTPPGIPVDHENILDSDSILSTLYLPKSLTVLGGGVIATEYATIFSLLGVKVTMIDRGPRPLGFLDPELVDRFVKHFSEQGGIWLGEREIDRVEVGRLGEVTTWLKDGEAVTSEKMLCALGRSANVEGLNLEKVGVEQGKYGVIRTDEHYRTSVPNIFAVGDVIGPPALGSTSMEQGRRAVCHALGIDPGAPFELVPIGIYSVPELASVGLTEAQVVERYGGALVGRADFGEVARAHIAGHQAGMLKLVTGPEGGRLLGVQIVGDGATDLIHVGEMALINGNDVTVFLENILNFPTYGEAYRIAALNLHNKIAARAEKPQTANVHEVA